MLYRMLIGLAFVLLVVAAFLFIDGHAIGGVLGVLFSVVFAAIAQYREAGH